MSVIPFSAPAVKPNMDAGNRLAFELPGGLDVPNWWEDPNVVSASGVNLLGGQVGGGPFVYDPYGGDRRPGQKAPAGASLNTGGAQMVFQTVNAGVPDWAAVQGYEDPQAFSDFWKSMHPDLQGAFQAQGTALVAANRESDEHRAAALGYGESQLERIDSAWQAWQNNPNRETVMTELARRAGEDFDLITPMERSAVLNRMAQSAATTLGNATARAAGRGVSGGGGDTQNRAAINAIFASGGLQYEGGVESTNALARQQALGQIAGLNIQEERIDQAYLALSDSVAARNAAIEAGASDVTPVDAFLFEELNFARGAYDDEMERLDEAVAKLEAESAFNLWDALEAVLRTFATFPGAASGLLGL